MTFLQQRVGKWIKFLAAGLPAFAVAVPANYFLVEVAGVPKSLSYALVLVGQVSMNYFMCRWFVFEKRSTSKWYHDFLLFVSGILFIRILDWVVYVFLVHQVGVYYIAAQLMNVLAFSVIKFLFSERVLS